MTWLKEERIKAIAALISLPHKINIKVGQSDKGCTYLECPTQLLLSIIRIQGVCWAVTFCIVGRVSGFDSSPSEPRAPEFSELAPDTTVTAGGGINKNSVSSSITRQQCRQQRSSLRARQHIHIRHMGGQTPRTPFLTHSLLHTYWIQLCEGNRWKKKKKNEGGEKKCNRR